MGGGWDGNNTKKILDKCDTLRTDIPNAIEIYPAIDALKALKNVVSGLKSHQNMFHNANSIQGPHMGCFLFLEYLSNIRSG